jgi:two-component system cell cycle sensor histidine kinase/response regulator CckA
MRSFMKILRYRLLVENADEAIIVIQDGMAKFVNRGAEWSGYSEEEYLSMPFLDIIHPEDRDMVRERYRQKMNGETTATRHAYRTIHKSGRIQWIEVGSVLIEWEGRPATLNLITDITERRQIEEEKRILEERLQRADKMEAIGTLAGGIAHDFNNLLMGIQGYASLTLLDLDPSHPHYERLKRIEEQVQSGADLTKQLLGFARGGRYEVTPADMNDILKKSSSMFGRTKKEIAIHRKYGKDLRSVEVDRGQMEQVFMNLFVNAWQAMPGGGEIYLETEDVLLDDAQAISCSVRPGRYVKISVTDTGTGMDEKTTERIFDPFFTTKGMGRGTGLGLATVYGIIKGHKGAINVYSEPGHGTTFNIYLPASEREVVGEKTATGTIARGTEAILLVDDEKMVLEVSREMLEFLGYRVHAAGSGQEALAVYMEKLKEIDLVILDMIMPGISGGETFDRLREINPDVRVLLSSGYSIEGQAKHILDRGCNGFIQKPFQLENLSRKVREILD